jgi:transposase-like protein
MSKRARRAFSPEFKARAVELVKSTGKSTGQVAKDLDLTETALREWVKRAEGVLARSAPGVPGSDKAELERLREEVRILRMERDFLKKAAAFFAKESR